MEVNMYKLQEELERDEGVRDTMYYDTVGVPTIGIGHNLHQPIPKEAIDIIFEYDLKKHMAECVTLPYWGKLSEVRKRVIINMMFNLGLPGFLKFKRLNAALKAADYGAAAFEMMDSKWYHQVGNRADRLIHAMKTNTDDELSVHSG